MAEAGRHSGDHLVLSLQLCSGVMSETPVSADKGFLYSRNGGVAWTESLGTGLTYYHCTALEDLFRVSSAMSETVGQAAPLLFI